MKKAKYALAQAQVEPLTLAQAQSLTHGTLLHSLHYRNADGTSARVRVTSVKTWKTRPGEVRVGWKHRLKVFGHVTERTLDEWSLEPEWAYREAQVTPVDEG